MEISFSSMFFHDHPLPLICSAVEKTQADTLEFWPETPDWWLAGLPMDYLTRTLAAHRFTSPLSLHAPVLDLNPCSINPDVAKVSTEWACWSVRLAEQLNAGVCTIHPGRRTSKRPPSDTDYRRLDQMLDTIAPLVKESGTRVAIENMEPQVNALLSTPAEIARLLDEREWLSFTLDVCHASSQGPEGLSEFITVGDDRIVNVHLSGASGYQMHLPVYGNEWAEVAIKTLLEAGYDGQVTLEINDLSVQTPLNADEKISVIARDVACIRNYSG
ncbi:MAG TPA: sugar phosphate isomerase/epimerase family protein [Methanospirillum sp.]|nr:sugar phosphate isomerase/epimerase family protein [Methanospirillum sp.]